MEVYFEMILDPAGLESACAALAQEPLLGFDTETTALDPFEGSIRLVQFSGNDQTVVIDLKPFEKFGRLSEIKELEPLRQLIAAKTPIKIAHNAKFDAKWVSHHLNAELGGTFDTFLASVLIAAGERERRHGLADVANFFLGVEVDKSEQVSDWSADELSQSQVAYAAKDAALMIPLREKLVERLREDELIGVAKLEFDCVVPIAQMELNGVYLDQQLWREQLEVVKADQEVAASELQELLSAGVSQASLFGVPEINLDSRNQVTDALINLGIPVPETTRGWELEPLADKYPVVEKLLQYRSAAKSANSFGDNILEFVNEETGRLHPDFRQIGAPTGRFSCSKPNVQQIPHQDEYRRCFRAPDGKKLIVADYSQIELRILAEFSKDENFISSFESGVDFHAAAAARVFNIDPEQVTSDQRSFAKRLNFGVVYGIGAQRFAQMTGVSTREAENILRKYFSTHRGLDAWLRNAGESAVGEGRARTASGRLAKFRFEQDDRQQIASTRRNGKNLPIQGTSADILKRALRLLHNAIKGTSAKLVNIVHDEIIVETDVAEAEETAAKVEKAMLDAAREYITLVPVLVDIRIGNAWNK
jgi:DNA polymerase I-like protein with 3'-5' exonuclease and polymerase domains